MEIFKKWWLPITTSGLFGLLLILSMILYCLNYKSILITIISIMFFANIAMVLTWIIIHRNNQTLTNYGVMSTTIGLLPSILDLLIIGLLKA